MPIQGLEGYKDGLPTLLKGSVFMSWYQSLFMFVVAIPIVISLFYGIHYSRRNMTAVWSACFGGPDVLRKLLTETSPQAELPESAGPAVLMNELIKSITLRIKRIRHRLAIYFYAVAVPGLFLLTAVYIFFFVRYVILNSPISGLSLTFLRTLPGIVVTGALLIMLPSIIMMTMISAMKEMIAVLEGEMQLYMD